MTYSNHYEPVLRNKRVPGNIRPDITQNVHGITAGSVSTDTLVGTFAPRKGNV